MHTRRKFIRSTGLLGSGVVLGRSDHAGSVGRKHRWFMPDEGAPHQRTWMAFGAHKDVWGTKLLPEVQRNLALIARAIVKFEPVSMLVRESEFALARSLVGPKIDLIACPLDDLWMRDTGAVFVVSGDGGKAGVDFNFNGWGGKQGHARDVQVAGVVAKLAQVRRTQSALILEGGGIEVDGQGTALVTESCVLNANRNPGVSKLACEAELKRLLGLQKVLWLPGIKGKDITDGHTDFYARFAKPGVVVAAYDPDPKSFDHAVTKRHLEILRAATDAQGRTLRVVVLAAPTKLREKAANDEFAAGYVNYYVCNRGLIVPEFGDQAADAAARQALQQLFPEREIVQLNIDAIAAGGGGIHCTTQQEPLV